MDGYDQKLLDEWRGVDGQRKGYRTLARELNVALLRREMDRAGIETVAGEATSKYERLTDGGEDVARETRELLSENGVFVRDLERDFVSYGVVRTHLQSCLEAEYTPEPSTGEWTTTSIEIASSAAASKATEAVRALVNRGELHAGGDVTVSVSVTATCTECESTVEVEDAVDRGYVCECDID